MVFSPSFALSITVIPFGYATLKYSFFLYKSSEKNKLSLFHRRIKYGRLKALSVVTWAILKKEKKGKIYCNSL